MRTRVLYFPYIRVPETPWLTQMLLYWDEVSSIVPSDYIGHPESLGTHMLGLVQEELVRQVVPGMIISEIPLRRAISRLPVRPRSQARQQKEALGAG